MADDQKITETTQPSSKQVIYPKNGELITSLATNNTYIFGEKIGEGHFSVVYGCMDVWGNDLAAKIMKPVGSYEDVKTSVNAELQKLVLLRHPNITYIYDAFEYLDTFYLITERCYKPLTDLFTLKNFNGITWIRPIAHCLLQAVYYLHNNQYAHQDIHLDNVFTAFSKDELRPTDPGSISFKLGDFGISKQFNEIDVTNTRADWLLPPEVLKPEDFGPIDFRVDLYHIGLLFLQLAKSQKISFSREEILDGRPREMALSLPSPYNFALEKTLRRHVQYRTGTAMELWRDLRNTST